MSISSSKPPTFNIEHSKKQSELTDKQMPKRISWVPMPNPEHFLQNRSIIS